MASDKLFPKGNWDPPKLTTDRMGTASQTTIHMTVGGALTVWENLEESLLWLFTAFLQADTREMQSKFARIYGVVESNSIRLKMIQAAAEMYFGKYWSRKEIHGPLKELMDNVQAASYRRNEIAHGKISSLSDGTKQDEEGKYVSKNQSLSGILCVRHI